MSALSRGAAAPSSEIDRRGLPDTEESFGNVITDIVLVLYPPPNTPAQLAVKLNCSIRNVEDYMSGRTKWSGDAIAFIVGEIMRRHGARNLKIKSK